MNWRAVCFAVYLEASYTVACAHPRGNVRRIDWSASPAVRGLFAYVWKLTLNGY